MNRKDIETLKKIHDYIIDQGLDIDLVHYRNFIDLNTGKKIHKSISDTFFYTKGKPATLSDKKDILIASFTPYLEALSRVKRKGVLLREILDA